MAILTPPPVNFQQRIRSEMTEALQLGYGDIIPSIVSLRVTLASTVAGAPPVATLPQPQSDFFRVPGDYTFLIGEVRPHLAINTVTGQNTAAPTNTGLLDLGGLRNRMIAKAMGARVLLVNADRNDLSFVENTIQNTSAPGGTQLASLCLSTLLPMAGGSPIKLIGDNDVAPLIVPGNERLKLTVTLTDANAGVGETEYGLVLIGAMVRSRAS
jgi:hypothetical protein